MKQLRFLAFVFLALSNTHLFAQTTPARLTAIEDSVIQAAKWIESTDLDKETGKRKEINSIVLKWYIDSISLNISLVEKLSELNEGNPELLMAFFAGYSRYYLENKKTVAKPAATRAGLISVMNVYQKGIAVTKSSGIDNLVELHRQNKLDDYIKSNFE